MEAEREAHLKPTDAAEFLAVSLSYFYKVVIPAVPVIRFGRSVRVRRSDLINFAAAHETRPAHELDAVVASREAS
jgi:excisionase family DNA binding protein